MAGLATVSMTGSPATGLVTVSPASLVMVSGSTTPTPSESFFCWVTVAGPNKSSFRAGTSATALISV